MTKQKFYETVDKYLMAMGTDIEEYVDLNDSTMKEMAVQTAFECRQMFDWSRDTEEIYKDDGTLGSMHVPDFRDEGFHENLNVLVREWEKRQLMSI